MPNPSRSLTPVAAAVTPVPTQGSQRTFVHAATPADINGALQDVWTYLHQQQQNHAALAESVSKLPTPPTAADTAAALSQSGSDPLNVSGLSGQLPQVQYAAIPIVPALPSVFASQQDQVVFMGGHVYHFSATPSPGAWTLIL